MPARSAVILVCGLLVPACGAAENAQTPTPQAEPEKLVEQLGSEEYYERQDAYARLRDLGLAAGPALRAHRDDPDLEVQTRARLLLDSPYLDEAQVAFYEFLRTEIGPVMGAKSFGPGARKQGAFEGKPFDPAPAKDENGEEIAMDPTLEWLARNQEADGHWDSVKFGAQCEADLEQTSIALLCFLSVGHTEKIGRYKENVRRAIAWLSGRMNEEGVFLDAKSAVVPGHAQAMATVVLCEAACMGRVQTTRAAAGRAAGQMIVGQSERRRKLDGWGKTPRSSRPDLFTTAWFVLALKSAHVGNLLDTEFIQLSSEGANRFLDQIDDPKAHAFRHAAGAALSPQATVLGVLARFMAGCRDDEATRFAYLRPVCGFMARAMMPGENQEGLMLIPATLAAFPCTEVWMAFDQEKARTLQPGRVKAGPGAGSWAPCGVWSGMGRVGSTECCYYPLTVYWRGYRSISR